MMSKGGQTTRTDCIVPIPTDHEKEQFKNAMRSQGLPAYQPLRANVRSNYSPPKDTGLDMGDVILGVAVYEALTSSDDGPSLDTSSTSSSDLSSGGGDFCGGGSSSDY